MERRSISGAEDRDLPVVEALSCIFTTVDVGVWI